MKKYIALVLVLVYVLSLVGCASRSDGTTSCTHKSFELENVSKLIVISVDGKRFEVTDTDTVWKITENIESIQFEKGESSENTNGFGSFIQWYDANDNLIESISVMGEQTIIYDGFFWTATDGNIDVAVLYEILENINQTDAEENTLTESVSEELGTFSNVADENTITFDGVIIENTIDTLVPTICVKPLLDEIPYDAVFFELPDNEVEWASQINSVVTVTCADTFTEQIPHYGTLISITGLTTGADNFLISVASVWDRERVVKLSAEDAAMIANLVESVSWTKGTSDCSNDCIIFMHEGDIKYHSDCGTFNDTVNEKRLHLTEEQQAEVNAVLEKHIKLGLEIDNSLISFTEEQIEEARQAALAYYAETVFAVNSIEYFDGIVPYGNSEDCCNFTLNVSKDSVVQEPDRNISLKLDNGIWEVVNEGY